MEISTPASTPRTIASATYFGSLQSIVTSSAQNDSGLFETNLRDERYLPFEHSGAISEWQLQLPADPSKDDPAQFDYDTISDVILHIRYTAREGGGLLRSGARAHIKELFKEGQAVGSVRLFSVRHEFPAEWAKFLGQTPAANQRHALTINLTDAHYPFWSQGRLTSVERVDILARSTKDTIPGSIDVIERLEKQDSSGVRIASRKETLPKVAAMGNLFIGQFTGGTDGLLLPATRASEIKLYFEDPSLSDVWLAVTWSG